MCSKEKFTVSHFTIEMNQIANIQTKSMRKMSEKRQRESSVMSDRHVKVIYPDGFNPLPESSAFKSTKHDEHTTPQTSVQGSSDGKPVTKKLKTNCVFSETMQCFVKLVRLADAISLQGNESLPKIFYGKNDFVDSSVSLLQSKPLSNFVDQPPTSLIKTLSDERTLRKKLRQALVEATVTGNLKGLEEYLSTSEMYLKGLASIANKSGETPLMTATINGHLNVVQFLVERAKVDLSESGIIWGVGDQRIRPIIGTALHAAVVKGHYHVVNYLSGVGQSIINEETDGGLTALQLAAIHLTGVNQRQIVFCLLVHGADYTVQDGNRKQCWELTKSEDFTTALVNFWLLDDVSNQKKKLKAALSSHRFFLKP